MTVQNDARPAAATARAYIDGHWVVGDGEPFEVINPATEDVLAIVPALTPAQADDAVAAAARAFAGGPWSRVPAIERSQLLHRLADLLERDQERLIDLMITEIGTPRAVAEFMQVPFPIRNFRWFADAAAGLAAGPGQSLPATSAGEGTATLLTREPIGVVLGLTAFNFPLNLAAWKIGGALASGCSIVLMCSPKSVLTTTALAALIEEAGVPPGAFNFVYGPAEIAEHLCGHPAIDFVTFTGSAAVGRRIVELSAPTLKRVVLELGGKSADVVLPGSDVQSLALRCVLGWTGNAGQGCSSLTRTLVHRADYETYLEAAVAAAANLGCGDPQDPKTVVGPLVCAAQRSRVAGYVDRAVGAGAKVLTWRPGSAGIREGLLLRAHRGCRRRQQRRDRAGRAVRSGQRGASVRGRGRGRRPRQRHDLRPGGQRLGSDRGSSRCGEQDPRRDRDRQWRRPHAR